MFSDVQDWLKLGEQEFNNQNYNEAFVFFTQAVISNPKNEDAWQWRRKALDEIKHSHGLDIICKSNDKVAQYLCLEAEEMEENKCLENHKKAIDLYQNILRINPEDHDIKIKLRNVLRKLPPKDVPLSIVLERPLKFDDEFHSSNIDFLKKAETQEILENYQEAMDYYKQALEIDYDDYLIHTVYGKLLGKIGFYLQSIEHLNQAIQLKSNFVHAYYHRGVVYKKIGKYEQSKKDFEITIKLDEAYYDAYIALSHIYKINHNYDEAIKILDKAIELKPLEHFAYNDRGSLYKKKGKKQEKFNRQAREDFEKAIQLSQGRNWRAWVNLGWFDCQELYDFVNGYDTWFRGLKALEKWESHQHQNLEYKRGQGELYWCIGKNHYRHSNEHEDDATKEKFKEYEITNNAERNYQIALEKISFEKFPIRHLDILQDFIDISQVSKKLPELKALLAKANDYLNKLISDTKNDNEKILLLQRFSGFNQINVDILLEKGANKQALELAEKRKNYCLSWLRKDWKNSNDFILSHNFLQECLTQNHQTGIVFWHLSLSKLTTFILVGENQVRLIDDVRELQYYLNKWKNSFFKDKDKRQQQQFEEIKILNELKKILNIELIESFLEKQEVKEILLVPHRDLHLLPLEYLLNTESSSFLFTRSPSIKFGINKSQITPKNKTIVSIEYPQTPKPLLYAEIESQFIQYLFEKNQDKVIRVKSNEATNDYVSEQLETCTNVDFLHFTGHAEHNHQFPLYSSLVLTNNTNLTLEKILKLKLPSYYLVCLSACETGVVGTDRLINEFVGIVSGFLAKGTRYVISTLWIVDEEPTALIMIEFYRYLKHGHSPANALNRAKHWLCHVTDAELVQWYNTCAQEIKDEAKNAKKVGNKAQEMTYRQRSMTLTSLANRIAKEDTPNSRRFQNPYYWAGFILTGSLENSHSPSKKWNNKTNL